jgi:hypothetical protein
VKKTKKAKRLLSKAPLVPSVVKKEKKAKRKLQAKRPSALSVPQW